MDRSARLTNGVGLDGSGGPMFTPDTEAGHPNAAMRHGGGVFGKAGASWQSSDTLTAGSRASLMHAFYTTSSHLVAPADITYHVTLVHAGGGETARTYGMGTRRSDCGCCRAPPPPGQYPLRRNGAVCPRSWIAWTASGSLPCRFPSTGRTACSTGRRSGCARRVPAAARARPVRAPKAAARAQLENLRHFEQLRSASGGAAAMPDAVEGGRQVWFDGYGRLGGSRRVRLRLTAVRDTRPAEHLRHLPGWRA
ncbi:hypothetical protein NKH18_50440 [Streptomyces sp. M10(2022)]